MRLVECFVYGKSCFWILLTLSLQKNLKNLVYKMLNFFKHQVSVTREPQMQSLSTWVSLEWLLNTLTILEILLFEGRLVLKVVKSTYKSIVGKLIENSFRKGPVKVPCTLIIFEILLFEGRLVLKLVKG